MKRATFLLALLSTACDTGAVVKGIASDGETFNGHATQTGAWDLSGTLQLVSDRGLTCLGTYAYAGLAGPDGKASYTCSNGEKGEATLRGVNAGTGDGTIGTRQITFRWGGVAR